MRYAYKKRVMSWHYFIPNRTLAVSLGGISGEFGRARVRMAKTSEPDMPDQQGAHLAREPREE